MDEVKTDKLEFNTEIKETMLDTEIKINKVALDNGVKDNKAALNAELKKAEKEIADNIGLEQPEKRFKAPKYVGREVKIRTITENHLLLVDDKENGFSIPFDEKYKDSKIGDIVYIDF